MANTTTSATRLNTKRLSLNLVNLVLDIAIAFAFVVDMEAHFTGLRYHEDLGVALALMLCVHLGLHWRWIARITEQFIRQPLYLHGSRFKYLLNVAVFADIVVSIATGIVISSTLGLHLALDPQAYSTIRNLHIGSSRLSLILIGLHIAVDWRWVVANAKRFLLPMRQATRGAA